MRIAGTINLSAVNGEGLRYVLFLQGCAHHCKNCHNPDTWDFNGGTEMTVEDVAAMIRDRIDRYPYDGITLSGGDPMYQEAECVELLKLLPGVNVWMYTGFEWEEIADRELPKMCDFVVVGPFIENLKCFNQMYGSSNQRIIDVKECNNAKNQ